MRQSAMKPHTLAKFNPRTETISDVNKRALEILQRKKMTLSKDEAEAARALKRIDSVK